MSAQKRLFFSLHLKKVHSLGFVLTKEIQNIKQFFTRDQKNKISETAESKTI